MAQGYRIDIQPHTGSVAAIRAGRQLVQSDNINILHESRLSDTYYFPSEAVNSDLLRRSDHRTFCPFKGTASYWDILLPDGEIKNGAWSYETPLSESSAIGGQLSFSPEVIDHYQFDMPPKARDLKSGHISSALTDWILREAPYCQTRRELVRNLGRKLVESGVVVSRISVTIWSLHPQIAGANFVWNRDEDTVVLSEPSHDVFSHPDYLNSPLNLVTQGLGGVRQPLNVDKAEFAFPIMSELQAEGATDYVAMPLRFSDGQYNTMTMACDHKDGFTIENLGLVFECVGVLSRFFEVLTLRKNTTTLLDTYLGKRTGQKILSGDIRRGQGEDIQAVILFSDLRNSTQLAEELPRSEYLQLLNQYFDTVLGPVADNGGEVLKFIGDAVLAIFPISGDKDDRAVQTNNALKSAQKALAILDDPQDGDARIDLGISLHVGEVTYGNVGGQERLDFTVIGPAVNLASRLEGLCKSTGHRILLSSDFTDVLVNNAEGSTPVKSIGSHKFSGIADHQQVFTPA